MKRGVSGAIYEGNGPLIRLHGAADLKSCRSVRTCTLTIPPH